MRVFAIILHLSDTIGGHGCSSILSSVQLKYEWLIIITPIFVPGKKKIKYWSHQLVLSSIALLTVSASESENIAPGVPFFHE